MRYSKASIIGLVVLVIFGAPAASAVKLSVSSDDVSVSSVYNLADPTSLHEETMILDGGIVQNRQAEGSGKNHLATSVHGKDYEVGSLFANSGSFSTSAFLAASGDASLMSHDTVCNGDSQVELYGAVHENFAGQYVAASDANLRSSQDLFVGDGVFAGQDTAVKGGAGGLRSFANSKDNLVDVNGGFLGTGGEIDAKLFSAGIGSAHSWGDANIDGINCLDDEISHKLDANGLNMQMDGLSMIRTFTFSVTNINNNPPATQVTQPIATVSGAITSSGSDPEIVQNPLGDPNAFIIIPNRKIDPSNPIQLYLKTDSQLTNEGLDPNSARQSVSLAANTWDYWTKPDQNNLFKPDIISDASLQADTLDGYSVNAFKPFVGSSAFAFARVYTDQYGRVVEADVSYNSNYAWTMDYSLAAANPAKLDLQSLALHELGHACGLGDLYTLPSGDPRKTDTREVMNSYSHPQHYLGPGDINGLQSIYGA